MVAVLIPVSAQADTSPRLALSVGMDAGHHEHPDSVGGTVGVHLDADVRMGIFTVGGTAGYNAYAMDGAPVHAGILAARAGLAVPVAATTPNPARRMVQLDAIGSLEMGRHHYAADGEDSDFLGPTTTYESTDTSTTFVGARVGAAMTIRPRGASNAVIFKLEMIGRRDLTHGTLEYSGVSCGGLFRAEDECSDPTHDMTRVGGTELGVTSSIGVVFGQ